MVLHRIMSGLYEVPPHIYAVLAVSVIMAWGVLIAAFRDKTAFRWVNGVLAAVTAIGVLCITVLLRSTQDSGLIWQPFAVFIHASEYVDVYNQMVLNIVLFLPLGLAIPSVLPKRHKHPYAVALLCGTGLSVLVELLQWALTRGYTEVDDVMLNTLGTAIGLLSYAVAARLQCKREERI